MLHRKLAQPVPHCFPESVVLIVILSMYVYRRPPDLPEHTMSRTQRRRRTVRSAQAIAPIPELRVWSGAHDFHELIYVAAGGYQVQISGAIWHATVGDVLYYPAGTHHAPRHDPTYGSRLNIIQWDGDETFAQPFHLPDSRGRIAVLAQWMVEQAGASRPPGRTTLSRMLELIRTELAELQAEAPADPIERVVQTMRRHPKGIHTVGRFARIAGMSASRFAHVFKARTGVSPMAFHRRMKLDHALALLRTSDLPIGRIAQEAGFATAAHFSKLVRDHTGMSPSEYRRDTNRCLKSGVQ